MPESNVNATSGAIPRRDDLAAIFAAFIAVLGWTTLAVDFSRSLQRSLAFGLSLPEAMFVYVRFFTILTNAWVALLMTMTAVAIWRRAPSPPSSQHRAALVYMIVTCAAYEVLLRHLWSPQGLQFYADLVFHDVQPALTVLFWLIFAQKRDLGWRSLPWLIPYPLIYLIFVLVAGALGAGYPYNFLDAAKLGYPTVATIALAFLGVFLALGALATAAARALTDDRSPAACRGSSSYR